MTDPTGKLVQEALDVAKLHLNEPALSCIERVINALGDALKQTEIRATMAERRKLELVSAVADLRDRKLERENADLKRRLGAHHRSMGYDTGQDCPCCIALSKDSD